jgi:hypothetical protein
MTHKAKMHLIVLIAFFIAVAAPLLSSCPTPGGSSFSDGMSVAAPAFSPGSVI